MALESTIRSKVERLGDVKVQKSAIKKPSFRTGFRLQRHIRPSTNCFLIVIHTLQCNERCYDSNFQAIGAPREKQSSESFGVDPKLQGRAKRAGCLDDFENVVEFDKKARLTRNCKSQGRCGTGERGCSGKKVEEG